MGHQRRVQGAERWQLLFFGERGREPATPFYPHPHLPHQSTRSPKLNAAPTVHAQPPIHPYPPTHKNEKDYLLDVTLELLSDPVPNVRLCAAALLPALKQSIRLPEDVEQLVGRGGREPPARAGFCKEAPDSAMSNLTTDTPPPQPQTKTTRRQFPFARRPSTAR